jgi:hypothetical protein
MPTPTMIEVFVEYSRQRGHRTVLPGGPYGSLQDAYAALIDFADEQHAGFRGLVQVIDAYGFMSQGQAIVRHETKP